MKIFNKILGILFLATISLSCTKSIISGSESDVTVDLGEKRYILFDSGISTRGSLVTRDYLDSSFYVLGYQYPGSWEIASVHNATPNVFDATPQLVEFDGAKYTYSPEKIWSGKTYSFFGYFPHDNNNIILFDGDGIKQGIPYITYTLPTSGDPRELVDLMTGSYIDTRIADSPEVRMEMRHRLSAIDIAIRNFYMYTETEGSIPYPVTIEITELEFKPKVAETKVKIYLDEITENVAADGSTSNQELQFLLVDKDVKDTDNDWRHNSFPIEPNDSDNPYTLITNPEEHRTDIAVDDKKATSLILLPQKEPLEYHLYIEYRLKYQKEEGGAYYYINSDGNSTSQSVYLEYDNDGKSLYFDNGLVEGRRYNLEITFTASAVTVNIKTSDEWDYNEDVQFEFE